MLTETVGGGRELKALWIVKEEEGFFRTNVSRLAPEPQGGASRCTGSPSMLASMFFRARYIFDDEAHALWLGKIKMPDEASDLNKGLTSCEGHAGLYCGPRQSMVGTGGQRDGLSSAPILTVQ